MLTFAVICFLLSAAAVVLLAGTGQPKHRPHHRANPYLSLADQQQSEMTVPLPIGGAL